MHLLGSWSDSGKLKCSNLNWDTKVWSGHKTSSSYGWNKYHGSSYWGREKKTYASASDIRSADEIVKELNEQTGRDTYAKSYQYKTCDYCQENSCPCYINNELVIDDGEVISDEEEVFCAQCVYDYLGK